MLTNAAAQPNVAEWNDKWFGVGWAGQGCKWIIKRMSLTLSTWYGYPSTGNRTIRILSKCIRTTIRNRKVTTVGGKSHNKQLSELLTPLPN